MTTKEAVRLADPRLQYLEIKEELEAALALVLRRGVFTPDAEVAALEREFASWIGVPHAVATASGSAALALTLRAIGVSTGDHVAVTANLDISAVAPITQLGAIPLWVDIDEATHTMSATDLEKRLTPQTKAVLVVHTQGFAAAMDDLEAVVADQGIPLIEDATHGPGAFHGDRRLGGIGLAGCFSLAPTKSLGALGNAGMVITSSDRIAERVWTHANYGFRRDSIDAIRSGRPAATFHYEEAGVNATMDELQAAVLRVKLRYADEWASRRRANFAAYQAALEGLVIVQQPHSNSLPSPRTCVIRHSRRAEIAATLHRSGISTALQYVPPLHVQPPYVSTNPGLADRLPITERIASELICVPVAPELSRASIERAVAATRSAIAQLDG